MPDLFDFGMWRLRAQGKARPFLISTYSLSQLSSNPPVPSKAIP